MDRPLRILVLEDKATDAELLIREVKRAGYAPEWRRVETMADFLAALENPPDLILSDYSLPHFDGLQAVDALRRRGLDTPFILVSGTLGEEAVVEAMKRGADDFLLKDRTARLGSAIERVLEQKRLRVERKQAEEELAATHAQLRQLLEHSPAVIYSLKIDGQNLVPKIVSENITRLLGFTPMEVVSYEWWHARLHPEDRERAVASIAETLTQGSSSTEYRLARKDGPYRWVEDIRRLVRDAANQPKEIAGVWTDITERHRAEDALRESERRFSDMLDNIELVSLMLDTKARVTYCNDFLLHLTGWKREEVLGRDWFELFLPPEIAGGMQAVYASLTANERSARHHENEIITRPGLRRLIRWNNSVLRSPSGEIIGTASIGEDITDRQRNERMALRSQRLEAIGTLAGGVAHDLNNALAPILMGIEMLREEYPQESRLIDLFQSCAKRGSEMVRNLLTFAKGAEGARVSIQPAHLIKEIQNMMRGTLPKNIHFAAKYEPQLPTVLGDPTQLHQILMNLCVNARDAMPHGGELSVEAHRVEVDAAYAGSVADAKPGVYVALRVRDNGTGIPSEILDKVFEPFFTTKGPDKGTGLGLSTVLGIVKGHGGFLQVYSQPEHGSTFTAYLPTELKEAGIDLTAKPTSDVFGSGEIVLFVDDEAAVREVARAVLGRLNYKPVTASDGAEGLVQAVLHRLELRAVLTDLHMPHLDGLGFVHALRRILPGVPILVTSGRLEDSVDAEFKALGVVHRLDKPFSEAQLGAALRKLLAPNPAPPASGARRPDERASASG